MEIFNIKRNPKQDRFSEEMTELETYQSRHSQVFSEKNWLKENFPCLNSSFAKTAQFREFVNGIYFVQNKNLHPNVMMCLLCKAIYILFSKCANLCKLRRKTWESWKLETQTKEHSNVNTNLEEKTSLKLFSWTSHFLKLTFSSTSILI